MEHEINILNSLRRILQEERIELLLARSGKEGLELLKIHKPVVIISDLKMPEMNGIQFLAKAKEQHSGFIGILLTAFSDKKLVVNAISEGKIWRYLLKPWDSEKLIETIWEAVNNAKKIIAMEKETFLGKKIFFLYHCHFLSLYFFILFQR